MILYTGCYQQKYTRKQGYYILDVISKSITENNDIIYLVLSVKVYPKTMILYTGRYQ